jgi:uncharacterized membrane protein YedE/YeeE
MYVNLLLTILLAAMGIVIGFLAQRSRMCFVAGLRDFILVRDRELLFGLFAFFVTIWFLTSVFYSVSLLRRGVPEYGMTEVKSQIETIPLSGSILHLRFDEALIKISGIGKKGLLSAFLHKFAVITFIGGWFIGLVSTFAGGCVLRQHVLLAQGNFNSLFYLFGFYTAVIVYYSFLTGLSDIIY